MSRVAACAACHRWPSPWSSPRGVAAACSGGARSSPTRPAPVPSPPAPTPRRRASPIRSPSCCRATTAPHDRLTEWWYYTGHLRAADGRRFGFEFVIFRAERGAFPTSWVSHLAITDEARRPVPLRPALEVGPQVDRSPRGRRRASRAGFDLAIAGVDPPTPATRRPARLDDGRVRRRRPAQPRRSRPTRRPRPAHPDGLGLDLRLRATKPPALHDRDGWIDFGPAGGSYYYSRTAMTATGSARRSDGSDARGRRASAWFDHQWGDFISVGGGGWDWFAVNLDDGTDLTLSLVRDADGSYPLVYGTLVDARTAASATCERDAFTVDVDGALDEPGDRRRLPGRLDDRHPGRGPDRSS